MTQHAMSQDRVLLDVAQQFGATLDLDRLLPLAVRRVVELLRAERALIALLDGSGEIERTVAHNLAWEGPGHPLPISRSTLAEVIRTREEVILTHPAEAQGGPEPPWSVKFYGLRFIVATPIRSHDSLIGVLYLDSRADALPEVNAQIETLRAVACLVGVAVENARLFAEQRYRTLLLYDLVHDFRSPLAVVEANAEWLSRDAADEEHKEAVADITTSAQRVGRMIDSTLALSRIDVGADALEVSDDVWLRGDALTVPRRDATIARW